MAFMHVYAHPDCLVLDTYFYSSFVAIISEYASCTVGSAPVVIPLNPVFIH